MNLDEYLHYQTLVHAHDQIIIFALHILADILILSVSMFRNAVKEIY